MDIADELAAALDNRQVTDDQGEVPGETTSDENTAAQNETTVDTAETSEKAAETEKSTPVEDEGTENEPELVETAADETGKRYVPESRFKEVYAKWKDADRRLKTAPQPQRQAPQAPAAPLNKADALEIELLRTTLPQFNPENTDTYDRDIDELGFSLYEASKDDKGQYTMTRLEAGRRALSMAKKITSKIADIKSEARTVKAQQSDHGIANRVLTREAQKVDPEKMTLEEKEEWLKANNLW